MGGNFKATIHFGFQKFLFVILLAPLGTLSLLDLEIPQLGSQSGLPALSPSNIWLTRTAFQNFGRDIRVPNVLTAYPESEQQVINLVNWAQRNNYEVRPSGKMQSWSPLTLQGGLQSGAGINQVLNLIPGLQQLLNFSSPATDDGISNNRPNVQRRVLLLKMDKFFNKVGIISREPGRAAVWAQPGVTMDELAKILEEQGLGLANMLAYGGVTLGGVLATGGLGNAAPASWDTKAEGHSYGSISNLVLNMTGVGFSSVTGQYKLQNFNRADPDIAGLLVNLGRMIITNVTLRVGPLERLRLQSRLDVKATELFAERPNCTMRNTFGHFLDRSGRVEATLFPYAEYPWVKLWTVTKQRPTESREVTSPYPFWFEEYYPRPVAWAGAETLEYVKQHRSIQFATIVNQLGALYGNQTVEFIRSMLEETKTGDIWGTGRAVLQHVQPSPVRSTAFGYVILTSRRNVQRVVHDIYSMYRDLWGHGIPITSRLHVRASGLDNPADVGVPNAQSPALSPISPVEGKNYDTAIHVSVTAERQSDGLGSFISRLEAGLLAKFNGTVALARPDWSTKWGTANPLKLAFADPQSIRELLAKLYPDTWNFASQTIHRFDPLSTVSNNFLSSVVKNYILPASIMRSEL